MLRVLRMRIKKTARDPQGSVGTGKQRRNEFEVIINSSAIRMGDDIETHTPILVRDQVEQRAQKQAYQLANHNEPGKLRADLDEKTP